LKCSTKRKRLFISWSKKKNTFEMSKLKQEPWTNNCSKFSFVFKELPQIQFGRYIIDSWTTHYRHNGHFPTLIFELNKYNLNQCFKPEPAREPKGAAVRAGYRTGYAIDPLKLRVTRPGQWADH